MLLSTQRGVDIAIGTRLPVPKPAAAWMGSLSRSESGTLSEDYSHYSGYSHGSVPSTLADLLERFTVEAQPDCTLKLRSV